MSSSVPFDNDDEQQHPYRWVPDEPGSFVEPEAEFTTEDTTTGGESKTGHPHEEDDKNVTGVFKSEIQNDPEICSSCFRRNYDVLYPHTDKTSGPNGRVRYYIPAGGTTKSLPQAGREARNPPRACECGRIGPLRDRPLPKERVIEYAWYLSETLWRKGISHNPIVLQAVVLQRKTDGKHGRADDENFARAVYDARYRDLPDALTIDAPQLPEGTGEYRVRPRPKVRGEEDA